MKPIERINHEDVKRLSRTTTGQMDLLQMLANSHNLLVELTNQLSSTVEELSKRSTVEPVNPEPGDFVYPEHCPKCGWIEAVHCCPEKPTPESSQDVCIFTCGISDCRHITKKITPKPSRQEQVEKLIRKCADNLWNEARHMTHNDIDHILRSFASDLRKLEE